LEFGSGQELEHIGCKSSRNKELKVAWPGEKIFASQEELYSLGVKLATLWATT
jgi:hypothetical protein